MHSFFRKPTFDGHGGEVLDGFVFVASLACVQFFCFCLVLYQASCAFELQVGRGMRSTLQDIRFLKVEYRKLLRTADAFRELQRGLFAFDACALTVEADNVFFMHFLTLPHGLIGAAEIFKWQKMVASVTEDVRV